MPTYAQRTLSYQNNRLKLAYMLTPKPPSNTETSVLLGCKEDV